MTLADSYIGKVIYIYLIDNYTTPYPPFPVINRSGIVRHYGICVGNDSVIHFTGSIGEGSESARILETDVDTFRTVKETRGLRAINICYRTNYNYSTEEIIRRARSKVGSDFGGYHLIDNNCEHFTSWCAEGHKTSRQIGVKNDEQDIVEKAIDRAFEPILEVANKVDNTIENIKNFFNW